MIPGGLISTIFGSTAIQVAVDSYIKYVSMILNGNGANSENNNSITDSSTNNFTITRNNTTTSGSLSPFGSDWCIYLPGSAYISWPDSTNFQPGTGNFTIEMWVQRTGTAALQSVWYQGPGGGNYQFRWAIQYSSGNWVYSLSSTGQSGDLANNVIMGADPGIGKWVHLALVRNGNVFTPYVNGVAGTTTTTTAALNAFGSPVCSLGNQVVPSQSFVGMISNVRYVQGTAVYTGNFTPPTSPVTSITNTKLLVGSTNRIYDSSSIGNVITLSSTSIGVQRLSPFNRSTSYSPASDGGSIYLNGTNNSLSIANNAALQLATGDFTIETWVYYTNSSINGIILNKDGIASSKYGSYCIQLVNSKIRFYIGDSGGASTQQAITSANNISPWQWTHIAVVKSGSTITLYVNGVSAGSITQTITIVDSSRPLVIGAQASSTNDFFSGYISNLRIVKGSALYSGAFTPPSIPLSAVTNTSLLLLGTSAKIVDMVGKSDVITVGSAQINTSTVKYGSGSISLNGTTDYLIANSPSSLIGSGDFTVECWIYKTNSGDSGVFQLGGIATGNTNLALSLSSTNVNVLGAGATASQAYSIPLNQWFHLAVVRSNGVISVYVNGTSIGVSKNDSTAYTLKTMAIGGYNSTSTLLAGYVDDFRITSGYARYTSLFTPPTQHPTQ